MPCPAPLSFLSCCEKIQLLPKGVGGRRGGNGIIPIHVWRPSSVERRKEGRKVCASVRHRRRRPSCPLLAISNARGESSSQKVPNDSGQTVLPSVRYLFRLSVVFPKPFFWLKQLFLPKYFVQDKKRLFCLKAVSKGPFFGYGVLPRKNLIRFNTLVRWLNVSVCLP